MEAASAMAAACSGAAAAAGGKCGASSPNAHCKAQPHAASARQPQQQKQGGGSRCGAQPANADFFHDAAVAAAAAAAAAAAVLPVYWLFLRGSDSPTKSSDVYIDSTSELDATEDISGIQVADGSVGLSGIECQSTVNELRAYEAQNEDFAVLDSEFSVVPREFTDGILQDPHIELTHDSPGSPSSENAGDDVFQQFQPRNASTVMETSTGNGPAIEDDMNTLLPANEHNDRSRFSGSTGELNFEAEGHLTVDKLHRLPEQELALEKAVKRMSKDSLLSRSFQGSFEDHKVHAGKQIATKQRMETDLASYDRLIRAGRVQESLEVLEEMEKKGTLDMDKVYHSRFFQECKKQVAVEEAFRFTRLINSPTLSTFNMLLSVCSNAADTDGAFGAFTAMRKAGFKADCMIYTTLISTCAKALKTDLLFQVFHEMQTVGIEGTAHTYGAMIDGCARAGELAKAFGVYRIMISKRIRPDRVIFNSLINACARSGAVQRAFDVFTEMKSANVPFEPNHVTMCSLIDACARAGEVERAYEVYMMMRKCGIGGTPEPYTAALHACSHNGDLRRAFSIYNDMKNEGVRPDEVFFSALIDVAGHAGSIDSAFQIVQEVEKYSLVPGAIIFSSLMGVCSNTGNWEKALVLHENIQALGIRPTVSTLNALITALCRGRQLQNAVRSLKEMKEAGVAPNQLTYSLLLEACEKEHEAEIALDLYLRATSEGIAPNLTMCGSIIGLCLEGRRKSIPPNFASHLWTVRDKEEPHQQWLSWALAVYRQTISAGIIPTTEIFSQVLGCLRIPETSENKIREDIAFSVQENSRIWTKQLVDGFGVYDPRASTLYEEAAALGVVPAFQCDAGPIIFDAEALPIYAAEVCLLTILKALRHRCAVDAKLPQVIIKFDSQRKTVIMLNGRVKAITLSSRNGQAIAALLRRLKLPFSGRESLGKLRMPPTAIAQWFRPSPGPSKEPEWLTTSTKLGKSIMEQQRAIRMGAPLPDSRQSRRRPNVEPMFRRDKWLE